MFGIDVDLQKNPNLGYFVKARETVEGFSDFNSTFLAISMGIILELFKLILSWINNQKFILIFLAYFHEFKQILIPIIGIYTFFASKISDNLGSPVFWLLNKSQQIIDQKVKNPVSISRLVFLFSIPLIVNKKWTLKKLINL